MKKKNYEKCRFHCLSILAVFEETYELIIIHYMENLNLNCYRLLEIEISTACNENDRSHNSSSSGSA